MKIKKSIITGGAGFIGKALAYKLSELGHEVTVVDMKNIDKVDTSKVEAIEGDLSAVIITCFLLSIRSFNKWKNSSWVDFFPPINCKSSIINTSIDLN